MFPRQPPVVTGRARGSRNLHLVISYVFSQAPSCDGRTVLGTKICASITLIYLLIL
jgi:hypothetical protein